MILILILAATDLKLQAPVEPASQWKRPWATARAILDVPYGAGVGVELFAHDQLSLGSDVNFSPAGTFVRFSVHYWPPFRAGLRQHQFLGGIGSETSLTFGAFPGGAAAVIVPLSIDLRYLGRPLEAFGFILGLRAGIGAGVQQAVAPHFALSIVTYAGIAFGRRQ